MRKALEQLGSRPFAAKQKMDRFDPICIRYGFTFLITAVIQGLGTVMLCPLLPLVAMEESVNDTEPKHPRRNAESIKAPLLEGLDLIDAVPNAQSIN
jgi:hypothetical protein